MPRASFQRSIQSSSGHIGALSPGTHDSLPSPALKHYSAPQSRQHDLATHLQQTEAAEAPATLLRQQTRDGHWEVQICSFDWNKASEAGVHHQSLASRGRPLSIQTHHCAFCALSPNIDHVPEPLQHAVYSPFTAETVESSDAYVLVGPLFNDYSSAGYTMLLKKQKMVEVRVQRREIDCSKLVFYVSTCP